MEDRRQLLQEQAERCRRLALSQADVEVAERLKAMAETFEREASELSADRRED